MEQKDELNYKYVELQKLDHTVVLIKSDQLKSSTHKVALQSKHGADKRVVFLGTDPNNFNTFTGTEHDVNLFAGESQTDFSDLDWKEALLK